MYSSPCSPDTWRTFPGGHCGHGPTRRQRRSSVNRWTVVTVRKQIERLKERASRIEVYFEGPHANYDLADYVVANGLLVQDDLARLGG